MNTMYLGIVYLVAWIIASLWCYQLMVEFTGKPKNFNTMFFRVAVCLCFNFAWFLSGLVLFPITIIAMGVPDDIPMRQDEEGGSTDERTPM
jgi:hypothetical protein